MKKKNTSSQFFFAIFFYRFQQSIISTKSMIYSYIQQQSAKMLSMIQIICSYDISKSQKKIILMDLYPSIKTLAKHQRITKL